MLRCVQSLGLLSGHTLDPWLQHISIHELPRFGLNSTNVHEVAGGSLVLLGGDMLVNAHGGHMLLDLCKSLVQLRRKDSFASKAAHSSGYSI